MGCKILGDSVHRFHVMTRVRRLPAMLAALAAVIMFVQASPVRADETVDVYEMTPAQALEMISKLAVQTFDASNVQLISSRPGISVHSQVLLDGWDTDIFVNPVDFNLMPGKVIHGIRLETHSRGTSFLTGRLMHLAFMGRVRHAFELNSKQYAVALSRIRVTETASAGGTGKSAAAPTEFSGTGFVVLDGTFIVTAAHVVEDAKTISASCGTEATQSARVLARDPANDIALLRVDKPLRYSMMLADEGNIHTGDKVFTIGFPVPELLGTEGKYSEGVVSALSGIQGAANVMQITTPIQPGNSGGALVNSNGRVVGIITSSAAVGLFYENLGTVPQNVNWAVKSDYLRPLLVRYAPASAAATADKEKLTPIEFTERSSCYLKVTT